MNNKQLLINRWFWGFACLHVLIWTVVPAFTHLNLPLDALEGATWGHQFELGYDKNPFLNAWLTGFLVWVGGSTDWLIYLAGALCTGICFWAVYKLGRKFLSPEHALIGVMLLEGMQYFNLSAMDLNDNVLEIALWPLLALSFYNATQCQRWRDWLLVALFAGLATMAKYYVAVILLPMFLFLVINPIARQSFKQPAFYGALFAYLLFVSPHFIWLYHHQGITLQYAFAKVASEPGINKHFHYASYFTLNLIGACLIPLLLFGIFYLGKSAKGNKVRRYQITAFAWQFMLLVGFGPFIVTILLSIIIGWALHTGWGAPLPILWGLGLIAYAQPTITRGRFYGFIGALTILTTLAVIIYSYSKIYAGDSSSANYPGRDMAKNLTALWHERYHTKLDYVAGPRWEAGNVAYYSMDKPAVYIEWNSMLSPWVDESRLRQHGAIFIWSTQYAMDFGRLKQRFPQLEEAKQLFFPWQRNHYKNAQPLAVWVAFLPPREVGQVGGVQ